jgi:hypothetical protein
MTTSEIAKMLGRLGGQKRAQRLSKERRTEIARLGSQARADSLRLEKTIRNNFDYVAAIHQLHPPSPVSSGPSARRKLPGIYGRKQKRQD